ncbi:hypothetical protein ACAH01_00525 [Halomicrobium sp. HM KBTZ05]|uniref:hypothetical protein n=1 Tax=Halomicrobium sp. HM KBTZ05 TaxID=3242663 RepID=UPI0035581D40
MSDSDGKAMWLFTLALGGALSVAVTDQFVLGRFGEMAVAAATMLVVYYVVLFVYRQVEELNSEETA